MQSCTDLIVSHFTTFLHKIREKSILPVWPSSLPSTDRTSPEDKIAFRTHYRWINAPGGSNLYYDQMLLVSAYAMGLLTENEVLVKTADDYVTFFLNHHVAKNGIFLWGNHYYWDISKRRVVKFAGNEIPVPVDFEKEQADYHEIRPIVPAWDIFWKLSPAKTENEIKGYVFNSLFDSDGSFNRHSDRRKGCAFLESGGIMVYSLSWLYSKTGEDSLIEDAEKIINFSYSHRDRKTGPIENNPTENRWDKFVSTTEIGLWGNCILKSANYSGKDGWIEIAEKAVSAYLEYGYDMNKKKYLGQICVSTGKSPFDRNDILNSTPYQPEKYTDTWNQFFPSHDYPLQFAECCISLYEKTKKEVFKTACFRLKNQIIDEYFSCRRSGKTLYAERYGRCIHFLWRCWKVLRDESFLKHAKFLAKEALENLYDGKMFRSHTHQHVYDSVDGLGYLFLSLIAIEKDNEPDMMGSLW